MFLLELTTQLLPPKLESDSGSGFSQNVDFGSDRKTQNPAGVDSGTPDPRPPLTLSAFSRASRNDIGLSRRQIIFNHR